MPSLSDFAVPKEKKRIRKKKKKVEDMVLASKPEEPTSSLDEISIAPSNPMKEMSEDEDPKNFMGEINVGVSKR